MAESDGPVAAVLGTRLEPTLHGVGGGGGGGCAGVDGGVIHEVSPRAPAIAIRVPAYLCEI